MLTGYSGKQIKSSDMYVYFFLAKIILLNYILLKFKVTVICNSGREDRSESAGATDVTLKLSPRKRGPGTGEFLNKLYKTLVNRPLWFLRTEKVQSNLLKQPPAQSNHLFMSHRSSEPVKSNHPFLSKNPNIL